MNAPSRTTPELASAQFKEDLELIPSGYAEQYGWNPKPDFGKLSLHVDMWSVDERYVRLDDFYVAMDMSYYRTWPPGVTFVNPETRAFDLGADMRWLPSIKSKPPGTDIAYHPAYALNTGETKQMICNSMCLEYYQSNHSPAPEEKWDPGRHTLFATLRLIQTMLTKPYYGGRAG